MEGTKTRGTSEKQGVKLLAIRDYLYTHTNEDHWVTSKEIIEHLRKQYGMSVDRKTVLRDISKLRDYCGINIEASTGKGFRIVESHFKPSELRLMIDSVQSARFITEKEAATITGKIKDLADVYTRGSLDRKAYVQERIQNMEESVVSYADEIYEAMNLDAKISFKYAHFKPSLSIEKQKTYSNNGESYVLSPFAVYWSNGNYYLYAYNSDWEKFTTFRIDRMEDIMISSERREGHEKFQAETFTKQRKAKVFDMFGGKAAIVTLQGVNRISNQIIDQFGERTMLVPIDNEHFSANVNVEVSPTFFAWVTTFGNDLKITNPPEVVEEMKAFVGKVSELYR